jgi:hypothetical protein
MAKDVDMTRRDRRYSPVRLELQRRIPRGTAWLFHWAATDGDVVPPDGEHRRLHHLEEPIGVAITRHYRDRIIGEAKITERWWNQSVTNWVEAGVACKCPGYKSVFLFVFDDAACRRCGLKAGTQSSQDQEPTVPDPGTESSGSERETQSASTECEEKSAPEDPDLPGVQVPTGDSQTRRVERKTDVMTAAEAWAELHPQAEATDAADL